MKKLFMVKVPIVGTEEIQVEADNMEQAKKKAFRFKGRGFPSFKRVKVINKNTVNIPKIKATEED